MGSRDILAHARRDRSGALPPLHYPGRLRASARAAGAARKRSALSRHVRAGCDRHRACGARRPVARRQRQAVRHHRVRARGAAAQALPGHHPSRRHRPRPRRDDRADRRAQQDHEPRQALSAQGWRRRLDPPHLGAGAHRRWGARLSHLGRRGRHAELASRRDRCAPRRHRAQLPGRHLQLRSRQHHRQLEQRRRAAIRLSGRRDHWPEPLPADAAAQDT